MLRELHISNLAVIADARIELDPGLNCFTGVTGAGKSLVIGAIELLLGLRTPTKMLRDGVNEGRVSGLFDIRSRDVLQQIESLTDIPVTQDGGELLLVRRLYASGRTSVSLNGNPVTLAMLKQLAEALIDVHGQHDHQYLLKPSNQLEVLDAFAGLAELRQQYHAVYTQLQDATHRLDDLIAGGSLRQQQLELYRFQADEIDAAALDPGEYEELQARASVLTNLERLKKEAGAAHAALYDADGSILERLKMTAAVLSELSTLDANLAPIATAVRDATLQLEDGAFDLGRYLDRLDLDPAELAEVSERLNIINRVLKKYGDNIDSCVAHRKQIGEQIQQLSQETDDLAQLTDQLEQLRKQLQALGRKLSSQRLAAAKKLAPLIDKQLGELGMEKASFDVQITTASPQYIQTAGPSGPDQVEFIVQTNPGLGAQPLRKIASGGELSRIMLALKSVLAQSDRVSVLVFDEIDANVGGRLGSVIGTKLRALANRHQVLCITHLPQIACYADRHLTVRKEVTGKQTRTAVRAVTGDERLEELSEMIGGARVTETTRAQARELLAAAADGAASSGSSPNGKRRLASPRRGGRR
jgi:DNA repair protein RecN (Recombination protein N)